MKNKKREDLQRPQPHLFRHEERFEFAILEILDEGRDAIGGEIHGFRLEFGHVITEVDETNGRAVGLGQAEELQNALVLLVGDVDEDEEDAALVSFGGGGKLALDLLKVRGGLDGGKGEDAEC